MKISIILIQRPWNRFLFSEEKLNFLIPFNCYKSLRQKIQFWKFLKQRFNKNILKVFLIVFAMK